MRRRRRNEDRIGHMTPAAELLHKVLDRRGLRRELREQRLLTRWAEVVGEDVAARTLPDGLDRGILWVRVASSAWLHQLSFMRDEYVAKANGLVGDPPLVRDVRFHLGSRKKVTPEDRLASAALIRRPPPRPRELPAPAQGHRLSAIEHEASGVEDDELREAIVDIRRRLNL